MCDLTERIHFKSNPGICGLRKQFFLSGVTPLDNHRRKRRLQLAPQHRLSRSIHFLFSDVNAERLVLCKQAGKDSNPNHRLWRPMCYQLHHQLINMRF